MITAPVSTRALAGKLGLRLATAATVASLAIAAASAGSAAAAAAPAYSNVPSVLPGNVISVGYEATSTAEFGDLIELAGSVRDGASLPVTVVMSIWACESGGNSTCVTTPGATWAQSITLNVYAVDDSGTVPAVGSVVTSKTQTFDLPYRPSYDPDGPCAGIGSTGWYSASENHCYSGLAHPITFTFPSGVTLPDRLIWTISFDTSHHGYHPVGSSGPWDSLNVGAQTFPGQPATGTDVEPDAGFVNSTWSGAYSDGGAGGTGVLRDDQGGWGDYAPLACFGTACHVTLAGADPTPTPTPEATPSAAGSEIVGGATATPIRATLPPTNTGSDPGDGSTGELGALLIGMTFGGLGLLAVVGQRRSSATRSRGRA